MQTRLTSRLSERPSGKVAQAIIRACVHCGFCNATCPTYDLLGNELDGPRGRIYQIKTLLEGATATPRIQTHLDRCLTCRACETTCPSEVKYGRLVEIGRQWVAEQVPRPWRQRLLYKTMRMVLPFPKRLAFGYWPAKWLRGWLPKRLRNHIPASAAVGPWPSPRHSRKMLVLDGCVQTVVAPAINAAAARVLDRLGISLVSAPGSGCCGALSYHLDAHQEGLDFMRRNIDAWWPYVEAGIEAIVMTASGCGVTVKDYQALLEQDPEYAAKAARISKLSRDLSEVLAMEEGRQTLTIHPPRTLAFHSPCTLQHGQKLGGATEALLERVGFELTVVPDSHLCCGAAGTYSITQPEIANQLRDRKIESLESGNPDGIATANIGCLMHLQAVADRPVRHWIEWLAQGLENKQPGPVSEPGS